MMSLVYIQFKKLQEGMDIWGYCISENEGAVIGEKMHKKESLENMSGLATEPVLQFSVQEVCWFSGALHFYVF